MQWAGVDVERRAPWWLWALGGVALALFGAGLAQHLSCHHGGCVLPVGSGRYLSADAIGGLPRLFTTGLFAVTALVAAWASQQAREMPRVWWAGIALIGAGLTVAKLFSEHSSLESDVGPVTTLLVACAAIVVGGTVLLVTGRRWRVRRAPLVVAALVLYAVVSIGLDRVTAYSYLIGGRDVSVVATYAEEGAEAFTALLLLAAVRWAAVAVSRGAGSTPSAARPW